MINFNNSYKFTCATFSNACEFVGHDFEFVIFFLHTYVGT
jgi:hypothetical protein